MKDAVKIYKGNIVYSKTKDELKEFESSYIVVKDGIVEGIFEKLPKEYENIEVTDFGDDVIIPAFSDLHVHAPQYPQRGLEMDKLLSDWLNDYTFPLEDKYKDINYAKEVYDKFTSDMLKHGTMHAVIFSTIHNAASEVLCKYLEDKKILSYVGKVNMDQNSPAYLQEGTEESIKNTEEFIKKHKNNIYVKPIITPRFAPTCSFSLLEGLSKLSRKYNIGMQTHIVESLWEKEEAIKTNETCTCDTEIYAKAGLLEKHPIVLAHFIFPSEDDIRILKEHDGIAVQCPDATTNIIAGIMPTGTLLDKGVDIGLGSDIAAGQYLGIYRVVSSAVRLSKIKAFYEKDERSIKFSEAFYMATKASSKVFENVGSFEKGYYFDALVIENLSDSFNKLKPIEVIERFCYLGEVSNIKHRYLRGEETKW